jgi:CRP-like cAMP-binding protein
MQNSAFFGGGSMLNAMGWLTEASPALRAEIARRCDQISVRDARTLYRVGDPAGGIFCLTAGRIEMHLHRWGGEHSLAHVCGPGWWIGDLAAISGGPRRFDVAVQRNSKLLRLSRAEIARICDLYPEMHRHLLIMTTLNMRLLIDATEALGFFDPVRRVAATLARISSSSPGWGGKLVITQAELASISKMSRRRTNAALQELEAAGSVRLGYGSIEITDRQALDALVEGDGADSVARYRLSDTGI